MVVYMDMVFIVAGIFIVIMYVYNVRKSIKNKVKTKNFDSVRDFHNTYRQLTTNRQSVQNEKPGTYQKYVTKYNSSEDFREK